MKPATLPKVLETCGKTALVLVLLFGGCATALVIRSMVTPLPQGHMRLDYHGEITLMKLLLNVGFPVALLAVAALGWQTYRARVIRPFSGALILAALVGVFGCALAAWNGLAAIHGPEINLWSQIWWR